MGNRATPPRSFNTVKHSNRKERHERLERGRMTLLSICVVILAIFLVTAIFIFCSLAHELNSRKDQEALGNETETNDQGSNPQNILYAQITQANGKVHEGELILVNSDNAYVFPAVQAGLVNIYENRTKVNGTNPYQISYTTYQLQKTAFDAFESMLLKYYEVSEDNSTIITSSYRTHKDQEDLGSSIKAGYSDHHTGFCVALQKTGTSAAGNREKLEADHWIYQNCHKYGFIIRYPADKTTQTGVSNYPEAIRYVGVAHATYMKNNNLCLEEYVNRLKDHTLNNALSVTADNGNRYQIYYIPANPTDALVQFKVPSNYSYEVSGDNVGGLIVTVNLNSPTE